MVTIEMLKERSRQLRNEIEEFKEQVNALTPLVTSKYSIEDLLKILDSYKT